MGVTVPDRFHNLTLSGNTAGVMSEMLSGTVTLAGGNNVTLSQNGNAVTISAAAQSAESQSVGMSNLGNTSGTTGVASGAQVRVLLAGGNNVTLSQSLNGASATVTISAANQTVQPEGTQSIGMSNLGNTSGTTGVATGTGVQFVLAGGNNVTLSQSLNGASGTITISAGAGGAGLSAGMSTGGNTSGDTGLASQRLVLAGGNNITLSGSTNGGSMTLTISGANLGGAQTGISGIANSQTTYTSGSVTFSELGAITIRSTTGQQFQFSVNAQSVQPIGTQTFGASNLGNTAGTSGVATGTGIQFVLAGGNNVTLSQSINGASGTITISAANETQTVPPIATTVQSVATANSVGTVTRFAPEDHRHVGIAQAQISGNTSNTSNVVQGSLVLAGGNNITLSQVSAAGGATITISAANETQTVPPIATTVQSVATANSVGTVTRFAPEDHRHVGVAQAQISGNTSNTSNIIQGSLVLAGGNNITLSQVSAAGGATVTISAAAQTVQPIGTQTIGASNLGNTVGTSGVATGTGVQFAIVGGNNVTLSQSINGASGTITISAANETQTVPPIATAGKQVGSARSTGTITRFAPEDHVHEGIAQFQISGNTSNTSNIVLGSLVLAGGNNITLSQSTGAGVATITISGPNVGGAQTGISGIANSETTYTSGSVTFSGLGAITIRSTTGQHFQFSVNAQTVESQSIGISNFANSAGTSGMASGGQVQFAFAGGNNITLSQSLNGASGTITISAANETQTVPPIGTAVKAVASAGSTGTITRFAPEDHAHAGVAQVQISGNTSNTSNIVLGSLVLAGGNNVTLSQVSAAGAATITISALNTAPVVSNAIQTVGSATGSGTNTSRFAADDHVHAGIAQAQISGNTSNTSNVIFGSLVLAGGNNVTLSQVSAAGAATITIQAAGGAGVLATTVQSVGSANSVATNTRYAGEDHVHAGVYAMGVSTGGNTSGNTTVEPGQWVLAGGNNITLSVATAANNLNTITISAGAGGGAFSAGLSTGGNTAGNTGLVGSQIVFAGTNNVTLSGSTNGSSMTVTISGPNTPVQVPVISHYALLHNLAQGSGSGNITSCDMSMRTLWVFPMTPGNDIFPGNMTVDKVVINMSYVHSNATATTQAQTSTLSFGIYTLANGTQLSLLVSGSTTWGTNAANNSISSLYHGIRWLTIDHSLFNTDITLSNTMYWCAMAFSSAGTSMSAGAPLVMRVGHSAARSGIFFSASASASSHVMNMPFQGIRSATVGNMPDSIAQSDMAYTGSGWAQMVPDVRFLASAATSLYGIF